MVLEFLGPEFQEGVNLTVRRGTKWSSASGVVELGQSCKELGFNKAKILSTKAMIFATLEDSDLELEHAPYCRTYDGLFDCMQATYAGFDERELITLVFFELID